MKSVYKTFPDFSDPAPLAAEVAAATTIPTPTWPRAAGDPPTTTTSESVGRSVSHTANTKRRKWSCDTRHSWYTYIHTYITHIMWGKDTTTSEMMMIFEMQRWDSRTWSPWRRRRRRGPAFVWRYICTRRTTCQTVREVNFWIWETECLVCVREYVWSINAMKPSCQMLFWVDRLNKYVQCRV